MNCFFLLDVHPEHFFGRGSLLDDYFNVVLTTGYGNMLTMLAHSNEGILFLFCSPIGEAEL